MFTIEQVKAAHAKVRSGADFPNYIAALRQLGVTNYETYVTDGHTDFYGENSYKITREPAHELKTIDNTAHKDQFQQELKAHQQGVTDYPTFLDQCAKLGIEKWSVSVEEMTCTYYDKAGSVVLVEAIPAS